MPDPATYLAFVGALLVYQLAGPGPYMLLVLGATQKGLGVVTLGSVALASGAVGGWLARRPGLVVWQERFAGVVMVALGLHLLFAGEIRGVRA